MSTRLHWILFALPLVTACDTDDGDGGGSTSTSTDASTGSTPAGSSDASTTGDGTTGGESTGSTGGSSGGGSSSGGSSSTGEGSSSTGGSSSESSSTGGEPPAECFEGGSAAKGVSGSGTCAAPFVIDLSAEAHGTIVSYALDGGADEMDMGGGGNCFAEPVGTARDVVVEVMMPADVTALLVSVDPIGGADARIAVAEDPSCFQPMNACADEGGTGQCEGLVAPRGGDGFFGTSTYVVVSEIVASGQPLTVRFQTTNE